MLQGSIWDGVKVSQVRVHQPKGRPHLSAMRWSIRALAEIALAVEEPEQISDQLRAYNSKLSSIRKSKHYRILPTSSLLRARAQGIRKVHKAYIMKMVSSFNYLKEMQFIKGQEE